MGHRPDGLASTADGHRAIFIINDHDNRMDYVHCHDVQGYDANMINHAIDIQMAHCGMDFTTTIILVLGTQIIEWRLWCCLCNC